MKLSLFKKLLIIGLGIFYSFGIHASDKKIKVIIPDSKVKLIVDESDEYHEILREERMKEMLRTISKEETIYSHTTSIKAKPMHE